MIDMADSKPTTCAFPALDPCQMMYADVADLTRRCGTADHAVKGFFFTPILSGQMVLLQLHNPHIRARVSIGGESNLIVPT